MKTLLQLVARPGLAAILAVTAVLSSALPAGAAEKAPEAAKVADLQLLVDVPPTWRPFLDDDISDALGRILRDSFHRRGYKGIIEDIEEGQRAPNPDLPLLIVRLHEWRITRTELAQCTLTATLRVGGKDHDLGVISGQQMVWIRERGRFGFPHEVADAYEDAATDAMRELHRRVAKTGLVPGLAPKK
jgi:hypothetical protein